MKTMRFALASLGLIVLLTAATAAAQSLGDIARESRQQRAKEARKPAKVYTNDNLPARPPGEGPTASRGMAAEPAEGTTTTEAEPGAPPAEPGAAEPATPPSPSAAEPEKPEDKIKTKEYWQARFKAARANLASAEEEQQLAEDELSLLQIQQARELAPEIQQEIGDKIAAKKAEVETKRAATARAHKALQELEKEFKESRAPAEWSKTD
jgi:hypothetical protein